MHVVKQPQPIIQESFGKKAIAALLASVGFFLLYMLFFRLWNLEYNVVEDLLGTLIFFITFFLIEWYISKRIIPKP